MTIQEIKANGLLLFECISGSRAYGLNDQYSDIDLKGVFFLPKEKFYGLEYLPQVNNETNDEVYYELGRFIELLIKNNPGMIELLATSSDCILYKHPIMDIFTLDLFLSRLCKETFAGYAITQIKKARGLNKKMLNPVEKERKTIIDFCYVIFGHQSIPLKQWLDNNEFKQERCGLANIPHSQGLYALFYDESGGQGFSGVFRNERANDVCLSSIPKDYSQAGLLSFNKDGYSVYCKTYKEYWEWVEKRNENRYQGNIDHGKGYDAKNMMHTIRLLQQAEEILRDGKLNLKRDNREVLLQIKAGGFRYEELIEMAEEQMERIEVAYQKSKLPETPDRGNIEGLLVKARNELYCRG